MFLLYHSDRCNTSETVFHWCYVNDLHTTYAVVCWVTTLTMSCKLEKTTIYLLLWTRSPRMNYSCITPEAGMVMKKASGDDSPLWQGAGKSFWTLPN
jgi:hypothetical protein